MNLLKQIRILKGLSQIQTADKLNITQASYARLEQGLTKLSTERIKHLAEIFEVSQSYFLSEADEYNKFDLEKGITSEYFKKLAKINTDLREKFESETLKRIDLQ